MLIDVMSLVLRCFKKQTNKQTNKQKQKQKDKKITDLWVVCQLAKSKRQTFSSSQSALTVRGQDNTGTWMYGALIKPHHCCI